MQTNPPDPESVAARMPAIDLMPRTARNRFGQVATLWTTAGLEHQLSARAALQAKETK